MKKRKRALIVGMLILGGAGVGAYVASPTIHEGAVGEAPELGRTGEYAVGTITREFSLSDRTEITGWGAVTGQLSEVERRVNVRFWYPSVAPEAGNATRYDHVINRPGREPVKISSKGIAYADANPLAEERFPLVIMSHGFGGWNAHFSNLGEHLASRGYVVASINHYDAKVEGVSSFLLSFGNVLVDRTQDQRQIFDAIVSTTDDQSPLAKAIDTEKVALIGYSMGGYGALASAGAPYDYSNDPMSNLPSAAHERLDAVNAESLPLKAVVAFAPWGGQPDNRVWDEAGLTRIKTPVLLVAGNQDDVVNYENGVRWLFDSLKGTERHLLTYREARHNIVGNAFDVPVNSDFQALEFLMEPVWRSERLNTINQHFVTAFLDLHVKGDTEKAAYLTLPTANSNDSSWETGFGEQLNGKLAGEGETTHWRGFQKRWAVGMDFESKKATE